MEEAMLEDINCLLGSGEVPNLFTTDEEADIVVRVRDAVRATGNPDTQVSVVVQVETLAAAEDVKLEGCRASSA